MEVLDDWKCDFAVKGDAPFVSALAKSRELIWMSRWLNDKSYANLYLYEAYSLLKELNIHISDCDHGAIKSVFQNDKDVIKILKSGNFFESLKDWQKQYNGDSYDNAEKKYRAWCLNNRLFANPLNTITKEWIADRDILQFPNHVVSVGDAPFFAAAFSTLKREYCFARYMAFEGIHEIHPSYENEQLHLVNTLDYVKYSGTTEKLKTSFRVCLVF